MASKNVIKIDVPESYYHVYARGGGRKTVFCDEDDYRHFIELFRRYLSDEELLDTNGVPYAKLYESIEVLAYCLMGNHFPLLVYQQDEGAMTRLMRGVMTAYSRYFNKKYQQSGTLFESRYKASRVSNDEYLYHISRYIHLNPDEWQTYPYSSYRTYADGAAPDWISPARIQALFDSPQEYRDFMADYKDMRDVGEALKHELAE